MCGAFPKIFSTGEILAHHATRSEDLGVVRRRGRPRKSQALTSSGVFEVTIGPVARAAVIKRAIYRFEVAGRRQHNNWFIALRVLGRAFFACVVVALAARLCAAINTPRGSTTRRATCSTGRCSRYYRAMRFLPASHWNQGEINATIPLHQSLPVRLWFYTTVR